MIPAEPEDEERIREVLTACGEELDAGSDLAVRLRPGQGLADVVRFLDAEQIEVADIELRAPTLDDVFLAKTGKTLEGAAEGAGEPARVP